MFVIVLIWKLCRDDLAKSMTVTSTESSGLRQGVGMRFVELPAWSKRNVGKTPPAASCEKIAVLQADGSKVAKDGVWELDREALRRLTESIFSRDILIAASTRLRC